MGSVWGDYDNDGYEDLFLYKWGRPELFPQRRGQKFSRVTEKAGLPAWVNANTAVWFDYDRDGRLDLFLGGYYSEDVDLWHLKNTKMMPESFEYAKNGGRKYLFHNLGDGSFRRSQSESRASTRGAGRWPQLSRTCAARAIRISSSLTITESPNSTSTTANSFAKPANRRASASHRRAA